MSRLDLTGVSKKTGKMYSDQCLLQCSQDVLSYDEHSFLSERDGRRRKHANRATPHADYRPTDACPQCITAASEEGRKEQRGGSLASSVYLFERARTACFGTPYALRRSRSSCLARVIRLGPRNRLSRTGVLKKFTGVEGSEGDRAHMNLRLMGILIFEEGTN